MSARIRKWLFEMKEEIGIGMLLLWFFAVTSIGQAIWDFIVPSKAEIEVESVKAGFVEMSKKYREQIELNQRLVSEREKNAGKYYREQIDFIRDTRNQEPPEELERLRSIYITESMEKRLRERLK